VTHFYVVTTLGSFYSVHHYPNFGMEPNFHKIIRTPPPLHMLMPHLNRNQS